MKKTKKKHTNRAQMTPDASFGPVFIIAPPNHCHPRCTVHCSVVVVMVVVSVVVVIMWWSLCCGGLL